MSKSSPQVGNWNLDIESGKLSWSDQQYKIYGYEPFEVSITEDFFIVRTTHPSDLKRIKKIIDTAVKGNSSLYNFKRRILKKDGTIGLASTVAQIVRTKKGLPVRIVGQTKEITDPSNPETCRYFHPVAFNTLYSKYFNAIYRAVNRIIYDKAIAQDICQEVFLKGWINIASYNPEKGEIYTWLLSIARNTCKSYFHSKEYYSSRRLSSLDDVIFSPFLCSYQSEFECQDFKELLQQLPKEHKEIIDLLFTQGFSQSEVSELKGMPLGTVKTKSRSAINSIRQFVAKEHSLNLTT
jgi:RNA polymerase sigma factor (sigma-70 family)